MLRPKFSKDVRNWKCAAPVRQDHRGPGRDGGTNGSLMRSTDPVETGSNSWTAHARRT